MLHAKRLILLALVLTAVLMTALPALAQTASPTPSPTPNPNANISWPPPVYVLRGQFEIRGSANLPNMTNYFIEFRPLDGPLAAAGQNLFFPAILPSAAAVQDDVLGTWNTALVPDGLYELRLTVNVTQGQPVQQVVGPVRVLNNPPPFARDDFGTAGPDGIPTLAVPPTSTRPLLPPTATSTQPPTQDPTPRVTVTTQSGNVRQGDGTNYPIIATLSQGQTAEIVGISNRGTGWYQVRLLNGQIGWMAPSIVSVSGNLANIPLVAPPPPPATPTPAATPTPISQINFVAGIVELTPPSPVCNETFNVGLDVANFGTQPSPGGFVSLVDVRALDGALPVSATVNLPPINPGQTIRVNIPITVSTFYNELHRITLSIDPANQIPETNEGDNQRVIEYTLQKGACP